MLIRTLITASTLTYQRFVISCHILPRPPSTLFPYTTLFRSGRAVTLSPAAVSRVGQPQRRHGYRRRHLQVLPAWNCVDTRHPRDRKSTRLNSRSHSDLVCRLLLEKKKK